MFFVGFLLVRSSLLFGLCIFRLFSYFGSMFVGLSSFRLKNVKSCVKSVKSVSVVKCHLYSIVMSLCAANGLYLHFGNYILCKGRV